MMPSTPGASAQHARQAFGVGPEGLWVCCQEAHTQVFVPKATPALIIPQFSRSRPGEWVSLPEPGLCSEDEGLHPAGPSATGCGHALTSSPSLLLFSISLSL